MDSKSMNSRVSQDSLPAYSGMDPSKPQYSVTVQPSSKHNENYMASGQSSWNTSGFAFAPNTNVMDESTMPSDRAAAARRKAAEVMAALKKGEPGDADLLMGDQQQKGGQGVVPLRWLGRKLSGQGKDRGEKGSVVR